MNIQYVNGELVSQRKSESSILNASSCEKMTICGTVRQNDEIVYKITDNRLRPGRYIAYLIIYIYAYIYIHIGPLIISSASPLKRKGDSAH